MSFAHPVATALAATFATSLPSSPEAGQQAGWVSTLAMFGIIFLIVYFMMMRPAQKQQKQHRQFLASLKKGDEVATNGGLVGRIYAIADNVITLEVAKEVRVRVLRGQIAGAFTGSSGAAAPAPSGKPESAEEKK